MGTIRLQNLHKSFDDVTILKDINLDIKDGEFVVFVGPSGCGKSTLLRQISGLDKPSSGNIVIDEKDVTEISAAERGLAMVFQSYALYPHMSVRQNLAFGLENKKMPKAEIDRRIADVAQMLEIEPLLKRRPGQLSGGQRQRVAIGRAIVREPTAFLLDEPLSNLDAELRVSMRAELVALHDRLKSTMIYVTHDQVEAMTMADRIVVMRDGEIIQVATPMELFDQPVNLFVAKFIGAPNMNFLNLAQAAAILAGQQPPVGTVTVGIRPQHLAIADSGLQVTAKIVESLGTETVLHSELDSSTKVLVTFPCHLQIQKGEQLTLNANISDMHFFNAEGLRLEPSIAYLKEQAS